MTNVYKKLAEINLEQQDFLIPGCMDVTQLFFIALRKKLMVYDQQPLPTLSPVIVRFKKWVESHNVYRESIESMLKEIAWFIATSRPDILKAVSHNGDYTQVMTLADLYKHLNLMITTSPGFNKNPLLAAPTNGLLAIVMLAKIGNSLVGNLEGSATQGLIDNQEFNEQLKKMVEAWYGFLKREKSMDKLSVSN